MKLTNSTKRTLSTSADYIEPRGGCYCSKGGNYSEGRTSPCDCGCGCGCQCSYGTDNDAANHSNGCGK